MIFRPKNVNNTKIYPIIPSA